MLHVRFAIFCAVTALMLGGPAWVQLGDGTPGPWTRPWRMYSRVGLEVCTVQYQHGGVPVDRYTLLGLREPPDRPHKLLLHTLLDVREEANRLCKEHPDLRVTAVCSTPPGFATVIEPSEPLCP